MKKTLALLVSMAILSLFLGGCLVLKLTAENFQSLVLHFELGEAISIGQKADVYVAVYPFQVKIKKKIIKISGVLVAPPGGDLPNNLVVEILAEHVETGIKLPKLKLAFAIPEDGRFKIIKKIKFNIVPGTMQKIQVEPLGHELEAGTEIWMCVDLFQKKKHAKQSTDCGVDSDSEPPPASNVVIIDVADNTFNPKSVVIEAGDTVRWQMAGGSTDHTTTALAGTWDSGFAFNSEGSFFERTFPLSEDGQTFEYYCATHQACCQMRGSIRVGAEAPEPGDGYS